MPKEDHITIPGTVTSAVGGGNFSILLENGTSVFAVLSGKMKRFRIRIIPGDKVTVSVSPYDPTHGLITHRERV